MSEQSLPRCPKCSHAAHPTGLCETWVKTGDNALRCFCEPPAAPSSTETRCECGQPLSAFAHSRPFAWGGHEFRPASPVEPERETPCDDRLAIQDYPAAARSIALNLAEFCDESLPYPAMIAESARRARAELTALRAVREAAERLIKAWENGPTDGPPMYRSVAALRAALASARPASGETEPSHRNADRVPLQPLEDADEAR